MTGRSAGRLCAGHSPQLTRICSRMLRARFSHSLRVSITGKSRGVSSVRRCEFSGEEPAAFAWEANPNKPNTRMKEIVRGRRLSAFIDPLPFIRNGICFALLFRIGFLRPSSYLGLRCFDAKLGEPNGFTTSGAMRLTFKLRFHTAPGESLWLTGDHELFGSNSPNQAIALEYLDANFWQVTFVIPRVCIPDADIAYHYIWRHADGSFFEDWAGGRTINPAAHRGEELLIVDSWNQPGFVENAFYTEPFKNVLLRGNHTPVPATAQPSKNTHVFRVKAPLLRKGQTVCLLGGSPALGSWNTAQPKLMHRGSDEDYFSAAIDLTGQPFPIEYRSEERRVGKECG